MYIIYISVDYSYRFSFFIGVKGNSSLSPMGEKTYTLVACTVNLGLCEPRCNKECCYKTCREFYAHKAPQPACKDMGGPLKTCLCTYYCEESCPC